MNHSESINELAAALAKAQGQMTTAVKDKTNPFLKSTYADLASVMAAARGPLSANGLAVIQAAETFDDSGIVSVTTMLTHSSGQWISGTIGMAPGEERGKSSAQVLGSIITYLRKYGYSSIAGVAAADDDDDDGNAAQGRPSAHPAPKPEPVAPPIANGESQEHWFDVGNTSKAVAAWLDTTFGVKIEAVHDQGRKMHSFANKDDFKTWALATFKRIDIQPEEAAK